LIEKNFKILEVIMKRIFYLLFLIPFVTLAVSSTGVGVDETTALVPVPMGIIDMVWIEIQQPNPPIITWDFNRMNLNPNNPPFPPTSFPQYYEPSNPNSRYYMRIRYRVRGIGWPANNWQVTIAGTGNPAPACGILLSDIEYGNGAAGIWFPFSTVPQVIGSGSGDVPGWRNIDQDYRVKIDGNETRTSGSSTTVIYTIQTF
jgi:hypothetical protein